eukprot:gene3731-4141_t
MLAPDYYDAAAIMAEQENFKVMWRTDAFELGRPPLPCFVVTFAFMLWNTSLPERLPGFLAEEAEQRREKDLKKGAIVELPLWLIHTLRTHGPMVALQDINELPHYNHEYASLLSFMALIAPMLSPAFIHHALPARPSRLLQNLTLAEANLRSESPYYYSTGYKLQANLPPGETKAAVQKGLLQVFVSRFASIINSAEVDALDANAVKARLDELERLVHYLRLLTFVMCSAFAPSSWYAGWPWYLPFASHAAKIRIGSWTFDVMQAARSQTPILHRGPQEFLTPSLLVQIHGE